MTSIVLVTGASRGIGKAIVNNLLSGENGNAIVHAIARSETELEKLKERYQDKFFYVVGDVTDEGKLKLLVENAIKKHGRIDAVIANAGVLEPVQDVNKIDVQAWKYLFEVNFFSILSLVSLTMPHLSKSQGSFIFVSSGASLKPYFGFGAYGSSKASLNHLAMTIAAECPEVSSIAVAPGVVDTQMQVDITGRFANAITPEALARFTDIKEKGELLDANVPGRIYTQLALKGIPEVLNGKYVRYNDERLSWK